MFFPMRKVVVAVAVVYCSIETFGYPNELHSKIDSRPPGAAFSMPLTPFPPEVDTRQFYGDYGPPSFVPGSRPPQNKCPLCDSSVYPYCGEKLLHDACCCTDPDIHDLPYQCRLADCRFLHANSCREHRLIANCCCTDDYRSLLKTFLKE